MYQVTFMEGCLLETRTSREPARPLQRAGLHPSLLTIQGLARSLAVSLSFPSLSSAAANAMYTG